MWRKYSDLLIFEHYIQKENIGLFILFYVLYISVRQPIPVFSHVLSGISYDVGW